MLRTLAVLLSISVLLVSCDNGSAPVSNDIPADAAPAAPDGPGVGVDSNGLRLSSSIEAPSAAYLVLRGEGHPMTLLNVTSAEAYRIELHESIRENDIVSMRAVERLEIPADGEVVMRPGGLHLMIFGISETARAAQSLPLTLNFADGMRVTIETSVADLTARESGAPAGHVPPDNGEDHSGH
jgi:periplasmic copper chaperone A